MSGLLETSVKTIRILRNPYGFSREEIKAAQLKACDFIEMFQSAYENMRDWAEENGVDNAAKNP